MELRRKGSLERRDLGGHRHDAGLGGDEPAHGFTVARDSDPAA